VVGAGGSGGQRRVGASRETILGFVCSKILALFYQEANGASGG
jgi:hypothetical protein